MRPFVTAAANGRLDQPAASPSKMMSMQAIMAKQSVPSP